MSHFKTTYDPVTGGFGKCLKSSRPSSFLSFFLFLLLNKSVAAVSASACFDMFCFDMTAPGSADTAATILLKVNKCGQKIAIIYIPACSPEFDVILG